MKLLNIQDILTEYNELILKDSLYFVGCEDKGILIWTYIILWNWSYTQQIKYATDAYKTTWLGSVWVLFHLYPTTNCICSSYMSDLFAKLLPR